MKRINDSIKRLLAVEQPAARYLRAVFFNFALIACVLTALLFWACVGDVTENALRLGGTVFFATWILGVLGTIALVGYLIRK
jgi:hypothetical protein